MYGSERRRKVRFPCCPAPRHVVYWKEVGKPLVFQCLTCKVKMDEDGYEVTE